MNQHDKILDEQTDELQRRIAVIDGNNQTLMHENAAMEKIVSDSSQSTAITPDNIDAYVMPSNPFSEKLLDLQCKNSACEDAMNVIKKAYDKDKIDLKEYL